MNTDISDTFFVRAECSSDPDYAYLWDIWVNVQKLRGLRKGIFRAHVSLNCQQNCSAVLPNVNELCELQTQLAFAVANGYSEETIEELNDLCLNFLLVYNEMYYRTMEAAARHY